jgi:hypothetical protein
LGQEPEASTAFEQQADEFLENAKERLEKLLERPLYLTAAIIVLQADGKAPENAASLIRGFLGVLAGAALADRWGHGGQAVAASLLGVYERLAGCAACTERSVPHCFKTGQVVAAAEADRELLKELRLLGDPAEQVESKAVAVLTHDTGVLQATEDGRWSFTVLPFQEFFAARGLVRLLDCGSDQGLEAFLAELEQASWSRELPRQMASLIVAGDRRVPEERRMPVPRVAMFTTLNPECNQGEGPTNGRTGATCAGTRSDSPARRSANALRSASVSFRPAIRTASVARRSSLSSLKKSHLRLRRPSWATQRPSPTMPAVEYSRLMRTHCAEIPRNCAVRSRK